MILHLTDIATNQCAEWSFVNFQPLRKALQRLGLAQVMPDRSADIVFSYSVHSYLHRVKERAKLDFEQLCAAVSQPKSAPPPDPAAPFAIPLSPRSPVSLASRADLQPLLLNATADTVASLKAELNEFGDFKLLMPSARAGQTPTCGSSMFRNPFDIPRAKLLQQIAKMRLNFAQQLAQSAVPILEGGLPGTRLKLQNAGRIPVRSFSVSSLTGTNSFGSTHNFMSTKLSYRPRLCTGLRAELIRNGAEN